MVRAMPRLVGVFWILFASTAFAGMGALTKAAHGHVGLFEIVFWRGAYSALVAWLLARRNGTSLRPGHPWLLFARSVVGLVAIMAYFSAIDRVPLGTATALLYTSPIFLVLLSGPVLGEERAAGAMPMVALAFAGVLLIVQPGVAPLDLGSLLALGAGLLSALAYLAVRRLRETDPPTRIVLWFSLFSVLVTAPVALTRLDALTWAAFGLLTAIGLTAAAGQLALTQAYRVERASVVGPYQYVTVALSYVIGLVGWDERLSLLAVAGIACIGVAGARLSGAAKAQAPPPHPSALPTEERGQ